MRCKACHNWKHRVRDCKEIQKRLVRGGKWPTHAQHIHQQDKGKNIVIDEDGFQQVRHRKNAQKNIFDIVNDDLKKSAFELGEDVRAPCYRSKQQGIEAKPSTTDQDGKYNRNLLVGCK